MKVSIILPCCNGERWIMEAINSVLSQTYKRLELLVIDDGSTDKSRDIISTFSYDVRVRYFYQENRGFSAAINKGINESSGDLVAFIGQDDIWLPNKLEVQVKYFSEHKDVDVVHTNYFSINSDGQVTKRRDVKVNFFATREKLIKTLFMKNFIGFETVLVKRTCFEVGLFDESMLGFSDHDMWLRIAGKFNFAKLDLFLVKKREHNLQLSKVVEKQGRRDQFLFVSKAINQYPFLVDLERKKLSTLYYSLGLALLQNGQGKKAKQKLVKAIRCEPWKLNATIAYLLPKAYLFTWNQYMKVKYKTRLGLKWIEA